MENGIIIAILIVVVFIGLRESVKHFSGEGGCCGGGSTVKPKRKKLKGEVVSKVAVCISGMQCENCSNRIESRINNLDGVACKVHLKKKEAIITANHKINVDEMTKMITGLGYEVEEVNKIL